MKHEPTATANALSVTVAIFYVTCALFFLVAPEFSMSVAQSWFHGMDLNALGTPQITFGNLLYGLITVTAYSWFLGYVFARMYNYFLKK